MREPDTRERRKHLVKALQREGLLRTQRITDAFMKVPREAFVPSYLSGHAYIDRPLPIGKGQTISAPHMVAIMCEELMLEPGLKVLEIGTGSGYHAAVVSRAILPGGRITTVEVVRELAERAKKALASISAHNVEVVIGDGSVGYPNNAPYDRIYYTCAAPGVPDTVMDQLGEGGILLSVEGPAHSTQRLIRYERESGGEITKTPLTYCVFVPLVGKMGY